VWSTSGLRGAPGYRCAVFTGIVRELGTVASAAESDGRVRLVLRAPGTAADVAVGDSVSVSGVCLTAVEAGDGLLAFDVVPETLRRSSLRGLAPGDRVNLEPAVRAGEPLGGHIVQGHVDGLGLVARADVEGLEVEAPADLLRYCVEKGSIAVDGVSLTIAGLGERSFSVALVPHTREATTLGALVPGDEVNLEADVLAKHVERLLAR
jgi:riboflavin synthase